MIKMDFCVYLLRCRDNSLYCGYTKNLDNRLEKHNKGTASKYTSRRRPVRLVYFEEQETISSAMKREIQIKKFSKKEKELLVKNQQLNLI